MRLINKKDNEPMFEEIKAIIKTNLNIDEQKITPEARLKEDLAIDSIDAVEIVLAFEEKHNIRVDETKLREIKTIGDLVDYFTELKTQSAA